MDVGNGKLGSKTDNMKRLVTDKNKWKEWNNRN